MEWDVAPYWRRQIERRLHEIGAAVKGQRDFGADRIADLAGEIDELRKQLEKVAERQEKIAAWLKTHVARNGRPPAEPEE